MEEFAMGITIAAAGSLINFIGTKVYNFFTGDTKNFIWQNQEVNLKSLKPSNDFEELKRFTRIVVIDDENSFPQQLFQNEGYSIEKWDKVKDYGKLENGFYDIIVLDIMGVALHLSEADGLGVLESLKKNNPAQIIISFSQHSYDLDKIRFFQLADENIKKPSDFIKIKAVIDNFIITQFKPERYINALNHLLNKSNFSEKEIKKVNSEIAKAIKGNKKPNWKKNFEFLENNGELIKQVASLSETILKFFK